MTDESIGELEDANDKLGDREALDRYLDENGYLLFRGILDRTLVAAASEELTHELHRQGLMGTGTPHPDWTGVGLETVDADSLYNLSQYRELADAASLVTLMEIVFHQRVLVSRAINLRYQLPGDEIHQSPAHQDHFSVGPNSDFKTFWIPLMDIERALGGLAIARGSHRNGLIDHKTHDIAVSYQMDGRAQPAVPVDEVPGAWLTTDYKAGDVLVFESCTVHRGLPNRSSTIRLSLDVRAQPASTPASWAWQRSLPEMKLHRRKTQAIADELGLQRDQFESLMIEMHRRGIEAEPYVVEELIEELSLVQRH